MTRKHVHNSLVSIFPCLFYTEMHVFTWEKKDVYNNFNKYGVHKDRVLCDFFHPVTKAIHVHPNRGTIGIIDIPVVIFIMDHLGFSQLLSSVTQNKKIVLPWPSGYGRDLMIQGSWVWILLVPVVGSHMYYVDGASEGTRKIVSLVLGPVLRQVKYPGHSGTSYSWPGLPAFNEGLVIEVQ